MADEPINNLPAEEDDEDFEIVESEPALDIVQETLEYFLEAADVNAVYGEPIESGDTLIIPTAEVVAVMGFGVGSGYGANAEGEGANEGGGGGGGGGGKILSRPVAVIISSSEGVRVEPVVDATKIALAALTAAGFMMTMIMRMMRPQRD